MFKTNNNLINYSFLVVAFLALIMPSSMANASNFGVRGEFSSGGIVYRGSSEPAKHTHTYHTYHPAPHYAYTPTVYSSTVNQSPASSNVVTVYKTYKPAKKTETVAKSEPEKTDLGEGLNDLAAGAILGSNSFLPSGLIEWIFFAILILIIVILVRRIFGADRKYYAKPLKHD